MSGFVALPDDVLLEILTYLSMVEMVNLPMVCRRVYDLSFKMSYWLGGLESFRKTRPLAFAHQEDLTKLCPADLRRIAVQTLRRETNWSKPFPSIIGDIRKLKTEPQSDIVSLIDGTNTVFIYSPSKSQIRCWNEFTSKPFDVPPITIRSGLAICAVTQPFEVEGKHTFGILSSFQNDHDAGHFLYVLVVEHEMGKVTAFNCVLEKELGPNFRCEDAFLGEGVVGAIQYSNDGGKIHAFDIATGRHKIIPYTPLGNQYQRASFMYGNKLYLLYETHASLEIIDAPIKSFFSEKYGTLSVEWDWCSPQKFSWEPTGQMSDGYSVCLVPGQASLGVNVVSLRQFTIEDDEGRERDKFRVQFWPVATSDDPNEPLVFDDADYPGIVIDGKLALCSTGFVLAFIGGSAAHAVLGVRDSSETGKLRIYLAKYNGRTSPPTAHELKLDEHIDYHEINNVAIDDFKGVVYVFLHNGLLYSFPYA